MLRRILRNSSIAVGVLAMAAVLGFLDLGGTRSESWAQSVNAAQDADSNPFSALVGKRRARRASRPLRSSPEKFVLASDDRAFLFETRQNEARIMFLCGDEDARLDCRLDPDVSASEIFLLRPTRGPRGDVIYKTAEGRTLLRIASYGGATVYWPGDNRGAAASKSFGDERQLNLSAADEETIQRRVVAASAFLSALSGSPIVFDTGDEVAPIAAAQPVNRAVLADSILVTAKGISLVANDPTGARIIGDRIQNVKFRPGSAPSIRLESNGLLVIYSPEKGLAGRLSSTAVAQFLEDSL